ncbi:HAD family hydrolase [Roseimaritima ulvae]|uniref:Fructose-1-phosphate phosphatase YqaB n=1 Tax=Roseimaritima ulvae TaxID=980254 RepID=A0A5B9R4J3_9BACT|nr:HAD-IA family hydrolase [Roseimaritima ulvae]QEG41133.1 Fructose-1-phosphate phosphatase YqaB [Roseimaritima ulvae]
MTDNIRALIFDCDGTLADTMPLHYIAWRDTLASHGFTFTETQFYSLGGQPTDKIIQLLSREQGIEVDVPVVAQQKELAFLESIDEVEPIQPIVDIALAHHGKYPMGVGSGGQREIVKRIIARLGLTDTFGCVVGSEDTELHKPHPDVFLEVAKRLGVPPEHCRVYEDADLGVEAARRAGMECFDVRTIHTPRRITA